MNAAMLKDFAPEPRRTERVVAAVKAVSDEVGRSMAQVELARLRHRPVTIIPITGARKLPHGRTTSRALISGFQRIS
jgi:aryl-alcohol dehydrogenase-like predicted oxidoreductase